MLQVCGTLKGHIGSGHSLALWALLLCLSSESAIAIDLPDRRRDQFAGDFSYYVYPIAGEVPGMGRASGAGASVLNFADSDMDFTAFKLDGDFSASGYTLLDIPAVEQRLIADVGTYDFNVVQTQYNRGVDSDPNNYILPRASGAYNIGQLTLTFDQRRYEIYIRMLGGKSRLLDVRDADGQAFSAVDTSERDNRLLTLGGAIDLTDDHLDPRAGLRIEAAAKQPTINDDLRSEFFVTDVNFSGYIPMRKRRDTLVLNVFRSDAHVTDEGETDFATLQSLRGLRCAERPTLAEQTQCYAIETQLLNELIAANRYGTATSLGGTQRLRSFDNGRFYAGHALSYGIEYRWNLTDENTPFDIFIAKGVRTGIQVAFFAERGSVAEDVKKLLEKQKSSYGVGFRVVMSGIVLRADYATGDEGNMFQMFISYPWSMFSVDSPG